MQTQIARPNAPDPRLSVVDRAVIDQRLQGMRRRIRALRIARGWTQQDLGDRSGYWQSYIGQIERGQKRPPLETLFSLAQALEVDALDLLAPIGPGERRAAPAEAMHG